MARGFRRRSEASGRPERSHDPNDRAMPARSWAYIGGVNYADVRGLRWNRTRRNVPEPILTT